LLQLLQPNTAAVDDDDEKLERMFSALNDMIVGYVGSIGSILKLVRPLAEQRHGLTPRSHGCVTFNPQSE